ncbi:hypothetical protein Sjap_013076 [Stephania japonica]|uniref:UDP-N-acetylmuramoyl-L-alanyl-D-glutamate synthetase n=1 Tax=Stephania japonica TaxID=461633 RepID=A0AAP0NYU7_9MAGN
MFPISLSSTLGTLTLDSVPSLSPVRSCKEDLTGQTVAVVGLGISGRAAARLALIRGASVIAIDRNENLVPLEDDLDFGKYGNLKTILGSFDRKVLENADRVVVSPGVPFENHDLSLLWQSGAQVMSELDFAAEVLPKDIKLLAVTGTNGKSTVTTFVGQMLHYLGVKAFVGGNIGNPLSEAAIEYLASCASKPRFQVVVVEVSSYQMEIPTNFLTPSVAVVLNLTPDHLERHKTMQIYAMTKCRVFSRMNFGKLAILPIGNQHLVEAFKGYKDKCNVAWIGDLPGVQMDVEAKVGYLRSPTGGDVFKLQLRKMKTLGSHNYNNAAIAAFAVLGLDVGVSADSINSIIPFLSAPPHRMQIVHREADGLMWIDDSKATNVAAAYTGIMCLHEQKAVVLLGGIAKVLHADGSNDFEQLVEPLKHHRCVITFGFSGHMIQRTLHRSGLEIPCIKATNLHDAVACARNIARQGDAILLSPGCASFDEFRNFQHRGEVFQEMALANVKL